MNEALIIKNILAQGLNHLSLTLAVEPLFNYLLLLQKWNRAYNLTAITRLDDMVTRHLLDSLAITKWVAGSYVLDVGAGAGFPGIPLAIACPELSVVLLDSNGKKVRFMQEVRRQLGLTNIAIAQHRVENYKLTNKFDTITCRAFSNLSQLLTWTDHLVAVNGIRLAMKGHYPKAELQQLNHPYDIKTYQVPGLDEARCCIIIKNIV
jgi:16S rRNA (guanine527-N7)-methyltransferase